MDFRTQWGRNIAAARRAAGLTQLDLGEAIPLKTRYPFVTISRWERGISIPGDEYRIRLAQILGVPARDLFPYPDDTNGGEAAA